MEPCHYIRITCIILKMANYYYHNNNLELSTLFREHRGLKPLIRLINTNGPDLLTNVSLALGRCAEDGEALKYIRHLDGITK